MRRKVIITVVVALLFTGAIATARHINHLNDGIKLKQIELKNNSAKLELLDKQYDGLLLELNKKDSDKQELEKKLNELEKERLRLSRELQAKKEQKQRDIASRAQKAITQAVGTPKVAAASGCNTGNPYKDFIYSKESGCNPAAVNSIGCRGIGQACPGSKLPCGADFACQDAWFSNYAIQRYGSWEAAYSFWVNHHWW